MEYVFGAILVTFIMVLISIWKDVYVMQVINCAIMVCLILILIHINIVSTLWLGV